MGLGIGGDGNAAADLRHRSDPIVADPIVGYCRGLDAAGGLTIQAASRQFMSPS
jgi:hypothetical protein